MAKRIAIISANTHKDPYPVYPLATAYLKSYIENKMEGYVVDVLDMNMLSDEGLRQYFETSSPLCVCVSIRNVDGANSLSREGFLPEYKALIVKVRALSSAPLVVGGAGFSIFPEVFMQELGADYGVKGEGEEPLCALIKAIENGGGFDEIPSLYIGNRGSTKMRSYVGTPRAVYDSKLVEYYWKESGMLNIQTKRGCPYECVYCTYPIIDGRKVRTVDVESIVETIAKAKRDYGASYWFFTDSVFNIGSRYNEELAEALIKSNLNISWGAYFTPLIISDSHIKLFKQSGLTHIEFGTESFCDETLKAYGKRFTFSDVVNASEIALKYGVYYSHFLILAGWGETTENLRLTIDNSRHLKHTVIFPYVGMRIYPGTKLHINAVKEGVLDYDDNLMEPRYYITSGFDLAQTRKMAMDTGKAWVFPDAEQDAMLLTLKYKRNKKGPLWEYLRKP